MTGRAAELNAQYATVEEILEQPSPLPQRLQQLCRLIAAPADLTTSVQIARPLGPGTC